MCGDCFACLVYDVSKFMDEVSLDRMAKSV